MISFISIQGHNIIDSESVKLSFHYDHKQCE